jgi:SOS-response transcriptional repressor LexA
VEAGRWNDVIDNLQPGQGERISTTWASKAHTYALRVRGDSMEPKFPDGSIIIVEPDFTAQPNDYVIVRKNGDEATFKQLVLDGSTYYLKPLNSRYPILQMDADAVICGVVKRVEMDV